MSANYFVIESVIQEKIGKNKSFTAHDITQEVRNRGHRVSHDEVRTEVHSFYDRGLMKDYTRTRASYPAKNTSHPSYVHPWCYHHNSQVVSTAQNVTPVPNAQTPASIQTVDDAMSDFGKNVIQIPSDLYS